jgi:TPP-dependent trihydroxycyclohexane-1,2-dione (THcHDO) dehydratase
MYKIMFDYPGTFLERRKVHFRNTSLVTRSLSNTDPLHQPDASLIACDGGCCLSVASEQSSLTFNGDVKPLKLAMITLTIIHH